MISNETKISKFLSLVLRHKPETIGLELDEYGWADIPTLIEGMQKANYEINLGVLKRIVESSDKQRFKISNNLTKIRANQGHSIVVNLNLKEETPPETLYHGTATRNLESIKQKGLLKQKRQHVHLSGDTETAIKVGMRYGKPVILKIDAGRMSRDGIKFYLSENNVWLCDSVELQYIRFEE